MKRSNLLFLESKPSTGSRLSQLHLLDVPLLGVLDVPLRDVRHKNDQLRGVLDVPLHAVLDVPLRGVRRSNAPLRDVL